jgi:L-lactate dehydrogenase (cytochrome)
MRLDQLLSVADFERAAAARLPRILFSFLAGGTEDNVTRDQNRAVFEHVAFRARGLTGVADRSQKVTLWGREYPMPIGIAPMGVAGLFRFECDLALACAAASAGVPFVLSGASNVPLERVQREAPGTWYQGYFPGDRARLGKILERLRTGGFDVIAVTIDTPVAGNRENNERNGFTIPFRLRPRLALDGLLHPYWLIDTFARTLVRSGVPRFANLFEEIGPPVTEEPAHGFRGGRDRLNWDDLSWLRDRWHGKLLVKGVLHPGDAREAVSRGLDAVMVSNHGGRQLDGAVSSLQALPEIVAAIPAGFPVLIDSGFRRGADVLKAIALGARLVFIGRPAMYGAVVGGQAGVARVLELLRAEVDRNLALIGCPRIEQLSPEWLAEVAAPRLSAALENQPRRAREPVLAK